MGRVNKPFFDRNKFSLCSVPAPVGYPQSMTHCGVFLDGGRVFLIASPYPVVYRSRLVEYWRCIINRLSNNHLFKTQNGEIFENPCLYVCTQSLESPTVFQPVIDNPIEDTPSPLYNLPSYNSDPDLFIDDGVIYILNRAVHRKSDINGSVSCVINIIQYKGVWDGNSVRIIERRIIHNSNQSVLSPCQIRFKNKFYYFYIESRSALDYTNFDGIFVAGMDDLSTNRDKLDYRRIRVLSQDWLPWHMSVFSCGDKLFALVSCVMSGDKTKKVWLVLGEFNEEITELTIYPKPLIDYNSYRSSACVDERGRFLLYATTVNEKIRGSKSVDGRDIIMATTDFSSLLFSLRNELV